MATIKHYNVNTPPAASSPEGQYFVKRPDNPDRFDVYIVSNRTVKKQENNEETIAQIGRDTPVINVDKDYPLPSGFYTLTSAISEIPTDRRKQGLIITYLIDADTSETIQFNSNDVNKFLDETVWKKIGSGTKVITQSHEDIGYVEYRYTDLLDYYVDTPGINLNMNTGNQGTSNPQNKTAFLFKVPIPANAPTTIKAALDQKVNGSANNKRVLIYDDTSLIQTIEAATAVNNEITFQFDIPVYFSMYIDYEDALGYKYNNKLDFRLYTKGDIHKYSVELPRTGTIDLKETDKKIDDLVKGIYQHGEVKKTLIPMTTSTDRNSNYYGQVFTTAGYTMGQWKIEAGKRYELVIGKKLRGSINAAKSSTTGIIGLLPCAGLERISFKVTNPVANLLTLNIINPQTNVIDAYDISNTVALYEVDNKNLPIRIDHSNKSYIEIPTPKKCWVNFLHNFAPVDQQLLLKYQPGEIEYFDTNRNYFRKKCEYAWQGSSSLNYFKKNWKIKFYNEDGSKCYIKIGEWIPRSQFHFKGDGMDVTRIKNSGTAKLIQKLYRIRGYSYMPWTQKPYDMNNPSIRDRFDTGALGVIDSVPCIIQSFDTPLGRYHLNLNKFPENFNAYEDDPVNRVFAGSMPFNENYNKNSVEELVIDKEGADLPDDIFRVLGNLMDWLISVKSDVSAYKEGFDTRFDLDNCLDYYCLVWMGDYFDNVSANFMMPTYDGVKFYYMWYDMDRGYGFGSGALADTYRPPTVNNTFTGHGANYMWQNFELAFADEIKARYAELRRSGFISVTNVETTFRDLFNRCTPADVEQDLLYWWYRCNTNVPGKYSSIQQFMCWLKDRLIFLDDKFSYIE